MTYEERINKIIAAYEKLGLTEADFFSAYENAMWHQPKEYDGTEEFFKVYEASCDSALESK